MISGAFCLANCVGTSFHLCLMHFQQLTAQQAHAPTIAMASSFCLRRRVSTSLSTLTAPSFNFSNIWSFFSNSSVHLLSLATALVFSTSRPEGAGGMKHHHRCQNHHRPWLWLGQQHRLCLAQTHRLATTKNVVNLQLEKDKQQQKRNSKRQTQTKHPNQNAQNTQKVKGALRPFLHQDRCGNWHGFWYEVGEYSQLANNFVWVNVFTWHGRELCHGVEGHSKWVFWRREAWMICLETPKILLMVQKSGELQLQLRLVVYPIIYPGFDTSQPWLFPKKWASSLKGKHMVLCNSLFSLIPPWPCPLRNCYGSKVVSDWGIPNPSNCILGVNDFQTQPQ